MVDIARPESVKRRKKIRRVIYATAALVVVTGISFGASRLRPALPSVEGPTVWIDTVKRGSLIRQVRGSGTLVPENIRWITATTSGRVESRVLHPGATVTPTSVILIMSNPDFVQGAAKRRSLPDEGRTRT
jgi:HlyD family secretion protein